MAVGAVSRWTAVPAVSPCVHCALPFLPFSELNHQKFAQLCEQRAPRAIRAWPNFQALATVALCASAPPTPAHYCTLLAPFCGLRVTELERGEP